MRMFTMKVVGAVALAVVLSGARSASAQRQTIEGDQAGALFGWSVARAGDINKDGRDDLIVGAPGWTSSYAGEGAAMIYLGTSSGYQTTPTWTYVGGQEGARAGWSVASAGDINNDTYADVIVGVPGYASGESGEGCAVVFLGSTSGMTTTVARRWEGNQADAHMGHLVGASPKLNNDSYTDVFVGAKDYDNGETDEGRLYVYYGGSTIPTTASWTLESNQAGAHFGMVAASAGDVDGNTYTELLVGAPYWDQSTSAEAGKALAFYGSSSGLNTGYTPSWSVTGSSAYQFIGGSVAPAEDTNKDGKSDVLVGSWGAISGESFKGNVRLYMGSNGGLVTTPYWSETTSQTDDNFGYAVVGLGVVSSQARAILIGGTLYDGSGMSGYADSGDVALKLVTSGGGGSYTLNEVGKLTGQHAGADMGHAVANVGLVNSDAYNDFVVGAPYYANGYTREGAVFLYFANVDSYP